MFPMYLLKIFGGIIALVLIFSIGTLIYSDFSALGEGDPEVKRILFVDKFKPAHLNPPGLDDGGVCSETSDNYATMGGGVAWKKFPVKYYINTNGMNEVSENDAKTAVRNAFETWDNENHGGDSNGNFFKEVNNRNQADIKVGWTSLGGPGGTLAVAFVNYSPTNKEITSASIYFDNEDVWKTFSNRICGSQTGGFDIEDVAAHEIGHAIGFNHVSVLSEDEYNTMYTYVIHEGETHKRTLGFGESIGLEELYQQTTSGGGGGDDGGSGSACPPAKAAKGKC